MEYVIMFLSHILKTAEYYFAVEGLPDIPLTDMLLSLEGLAYHIADLASLYMAVIFL